MSHLVSSPFPLDKEGYADFTKAVVADDEIAFPAYAYAFIMHHARDFVGWVYYCHLIERSSDSNKERVFRRSEVIKIFREIFNITEQGAYGILRRGNGYFWQYEKGEPFLEIFETREIHALIHANQFLAWIPVELIAIPKSSFANLLELRAHMSLRAQSKDLEGETLTPMAYTAKFGRVRMAAARRYRNILRRARYLDTQSNYCFYVKPATAPPHPAEFQARRNPKETCRRLADTVIIDPAKVVDPNREYHIPKAKGWDEGLYEECILTYTFFDRSGIPTRPPWAVS